jgi:hypothetical protein
MWICDGRRLHRYDPTTVQLVAATDLAVDCGQVCVTSSVVIAWSYNENDAESGTSAAAIVDVGVPVVFDRTVRFGGYRGARPILVPAVVDHVVFFPGAGGSRAVIVDSATGTVGTLPTWDTRRAASSS